MVFLNIFSYLVLEYEGFFMLNVCLKDWFLFIIFGGIVLFVLII